MKKDNYRLPERLSPIPEGKEKTIFRKEVITKTARKIEEEQKKDLEERSQTPITLSRRDAASSILPSSKNSPSNSPQSPSIATDQNCCIIC